MRSISGGLLVQAEDMGPDLAWEVVTKNKAVAQEQSLCQFATMACKHLKSNAIALVSAIEGGMQLVGAGMGQPNRIDALKNLAVPRAVQKKIPMDQVVMASDAFLPFPDIIEVCHQQGISKIIQPGGSIRDREVIEAADRYGLSMGLSGRRHFRH